MVPNTVKIHHRSAANAHSFENLYPLYVHDLSSFTKQQTNQHGIIEGKSQTTTLHQQAQGLNTYWDNHTKNLLPLLITANDQPIGFAVVLRGATLGLTSNYCIEEFFIMRSHRGTGIAQQAAKQIFKMFPGSWELEVIKANLPALAFWQKLLIDAATMKSEHARDELEFVIIQF